MCIHIKKEKKKKYLFIFSVCNKDSYLYLLKRREIFGSLLLLTGIPPHANRHSKS